RKEAQVMLIWLISHLYALPHRARQHDKRVAFAVTPALCLSASFLPPQAWPPRPSTCPGRHVSRGHEARPETDDTRQPVYQIGTNIRRAYSAIGAIWDACRTNRCLPPVTVTRAVLLRPPTWPPDLGSRPWPVRGLSFGLIHP